MTSDDFNPAEHQTVATMRLSGTDVRVGAAQRPNPAENSVWLDSDEQVEAVWMSASEARLLVAALTLAIEMAEEIRP